MSPKPIYWRLILPVAAAKLLLHLFTNVNYGFHRDEMLYLALGRHLDFGYWSNPPLIGWIAAFVQATLGDSMFAVRLLPTLASTATLILAGLMAREMRGGKYAQTLAPLGILFSTSYVRSGWLFQPVVFDIFFWTLFTYLILRYLNTENKRYLLYFGVAFGLGLLNKYIVIFFLIALIIGLLLTPYRRLLWSKHTLLAVLIVLAIVAPNIIWQYNHDFPVLIHMRELSENQLSNVNYGEFLLEQVLDSMPVVIIWVGGLILLLYYQEARKYQLLAWTFLATILLFLLFRGKSYYTLGIYPVMIAAGSVFWERTTTSSWLRLAIPVLSFLLILPVTPLGIPFLSVPKMVDYCQKLRDKTGIVAHVLWEDGRIYPLPQDYADQLGWEELAQQVVTAYQQVEDKSKVLIYCENYGQAGAVELFSKGVNLPQVNSFSDTYRLWIQKTTDANTLIYVNDELGEDVQRLFADIQMIGKIENPYAREHGTTVYLCQKPRESFGAFWKMRVAQVLARQ